MNAMYRYGLKDQALEVFSMQSTDSNEGDEEEKENRTPPQKKKAPESSKDAKEGNDKEKDNRPQAPKKRKAVESETGTKDEHKKDEESQTPPQKKKVLEPDTAEKKSSGDEHAKKSNVGASVISNFFRKRPRETGEKATASSSTATKEARTELAAPAPAIVDSTSFKEGDVIEVAQPIRSLNSSTSVANLLLGQRGCLVQIDAAGDFLIHAFEHKEALQWVPKADISKLRRLPTPPMVPKPGV